jgi:UDP:flavonoid glycosyltransferase YjiC (YdhE family)
MRVLVASTAGSGHVFPVVPLARALRDAGHDVLWATGAEAAGTLGRAGIPMVVAGLDAGARRAAAEPRLAHLPSLPVPERRPVLASVLFAEVGAPAMAADLRPILDRGRFDLVVAEVLELAAPALAMARGIPHVTVGVGALLPAPVLERVAAAVAPVWEAEGLQAPADAGLYRHRYVHPFPPSLGAVPPDRPVVRCRLVGFDDADGTAGPGDPAWIDALGRERPFVYATFGTVFSGQAPVDELLGALAQVDVDAVVTLGPAADLPPDSAVPGNVRVERYVPQHALLRRAALVVSHAGSGTLLGAASHGCPQVCLPLSADQFDNADAMAASGAGVRVDVDGLDADRLAGVIQVALADERAAAAARVVADEIAALATPTDVVAALPDLVRRGPGRTDP